MDEDLVDQGWEVTPSKDLADTGARIVTDGGNKMSARALEFRMIFLAEPDEARLFFCIIREENLK